MNLSVIIVVVFLSTLSTLSTRHVNLKQSNVLDQRLETVKSEIITLANVSEQGSENTNYKGNGSHSERPPNKEANNGDGAYNEKLANSGYRIKVYKPDNETLQNEDTKEGHKKSGSIKGTPHVDVYINSIHGVLNRTQ